MWQGCRRQVESIPGAAGGRSTWRVRLWRSNCILHLLISHFLLVVHRDALDSLQLKRYCCRRMVLTHVDLIEKLLLYNCAFHHTSVFLYSIVMFNVQRLILSRSNGEIACQANSWNADVIPLVEFGRHELLKATRQTLSLVFSSNTLPIWMQISRMYLLKFVSKLREAAAVCPFTRDLPSRPFTHISRCIVLQSNLKQNPLLLYSCVWWL